MRHFFKKNFQHLFLIGFLLHSFVSIAQINSDTTLIRQTIDSFFTGMLEGDSSMIRATLHPAIRFLTCTKDNNGSDILVSESVNDFLTAVGKPREDYWNEKITSFTLQIDQNMAQVWTDYSFHINDSFSHCGVNSFQLFKDSNGWRIVQIMDTRRRKPCND